MFCGFVSGSVIINVISWTRMLKPLHTMAHIRILLLEESCYTMNYKPCQSAALQLGVVLVTEKDVLEDIACTHSFAMKAYAHERNGNGPTAYPVCLKHFETIALLSKARVTEICTRNSSKEAA